MIAGGPDDRKPGQGAFFGRKKGHKLRDRKQRLIDCLLPSLTIDISQPKPDEISRLFAHPCGPVRMEIGFGGGEYLAAKAERNKNIGYIGVEPFINGMAKLLGEIEDRGLHNIRLYSNDAIELLDWLPPDCLEQIDLIYPDPWPKRRHWKRRFVNQVNLDRMARVLVPGGQFRFACDIVSYVNWTLTRCQYHPAFTWKAVAADDWRMPWQGWHSTRYEAKAIREGRTPAYLSFITGN